MTLAERTASELALFIASNQIAELRALHVGGRGRTFAGWFDGAHLHDMARHALALSRQAAGVYFTPNPVDPQLAAKRMNRVLDVHKGFGLTHDSDILERRYLIVDLDPVREGAIDPLTDTFVPPDQNSPTTARELAFTLRAARRHVIPFLADIGLASPITMLSGNGIHLIYRMDALPGGKAGSSDPAASILSLLNSRYSCISFKVDPNTYNPCRMLKVPGTIVRRGTAFPARPHRMARLIEVPHGWHAPSPVEYRATSTDTEPGPPGPSSQPGTATGTAAAPETHGRARQGRPGMAREKPSSKLTARKPAVAEPAAASLFDAGRSGTGRASH